MRTAPATSHPPRHARRGGHRASALRAALIGALAVVLFVGTAGAIALNEIQGNIDQHDIGQMLGSDRPDGTGDGDGDGDVTPIDRKAGEEINILVMGSDRRAGASDIDGSGASGAVEGMRSDTTMIAHISADRARVEVISIPRDTLVDVPSCTLPDGTQTEPRTDAMFNSAFALGGQTGDVGAAAACTIRTVEQLTGIFIDDFVVVDFDGFIHVVDALGGVPMYVPEPIEDPNAALELPQGCQVLDGREALGLARARKSLGDGSDISRIGRQQELVAAIAREALDKNLLTDMPALYRFLDAATSTLTTGPIGELRTLAGLAYSLRGLDPVDITFLTMPFEWAGARVVPSAEAEPVWDAVIADEPIEGTLTGTGQAPPEEPATTDTPAGQEPATTDTPAGQDPAASPTPPDPSPGPAAPSEAAPSAEPVCTK